MTIRLDVALITLLNEALAPITSRIGFLNVGFEDATEALRGWRAQLNGAAQVAVRPLVGELPQLVSALEPLTGGGRPRELVVQTRAEQWSAYLDNSVGGTDADSAIRALSKLLGVNGVFVTTIPHTLPPVEAPGRYGSVRLTMVGPNGTPPLGYVRVVAVTHDGSRWVFDTDGDIQPFETPERYTARRIRDRFNSEMLAEYCAALGLHPFVAEFYGPQARLVETAFTPPPEAKVLSLAEAQRWSGIQPGLAETLPG